MNTVGDGSNGYPTKRLKVEDRFDDIGDRFAHRLAIMLEVTLLDSNGVWQEAHALLAEYYEALYERDRRLGIPYVSGLGKD